MESELNTISVTIIKSDTHLNSIKLDYKLSITIEHILFNIYYS